MIRRLAVALLVLVGFAAHAGAADFTLLGDTITMTGRIAPSDPLKLSKLIRKGARAIVLESPGGLVAAASYMARHDQRGRADHDRDRRLRFRLHDPLLRGEPSRAFRPPRLPSGHR